MACLLVALSCWMPPTPPPTILPDMPVASGRTEAQEHGWRAPPPVMEVSLPPRRQQPTIRPDVEQWRPLVTSWFGVNTDAALTVIACESGGNSDAANPRSTARGLFQHLERFWDERAAAAGWAGANILDPEANIAVAAWLSGGGTDWTHWVCKP